MGTTYGEEHLGRSSAASQRLDNGSQVLLFDANGSSSMQSPVSALDLRPVNASEWTIAQPSPALSVRIEVPPGILQVAVSSWGANVSGSFSIFLWDATIHATNVTGNHSYRAGNWTEGIGPASPGQPNLVRYRHYQSLRLDIIHGSFQFIGKDSPQAWLARSVQVAGQGEAKFGRVVGTFQDGAEQTDLRRDSLVATGNFSMTNWNETTLPGHFGISMHALRSVLGVDTPAQKRTDTENPRLAVPSPPPRVPLALAYLAGVMGLGAVSLLAVRRARGPTLDDVEWALLERRPALAVRLARRLLRRDKSDATAIFLYGTALFIVGDFRRLISKVEPLATKLPPPTRLGVAYLIASASHSLGDHRRFRRWAREAAMEPRLREQMARDGIWRQSVAAVATPAGYA